jgi:hypothetical protein
MVSGPIPLRLLWSFESGRAHQRWRGRSAPPQTDTRGRHQAPAHLIVLHDGQQATVQNAELLAQHSPDNKQRFNEDGQIGVALDQFSDARLELQIPDDPDLEAEVTQSSAQIIFDGDGLRLQQLAMGQQHAQLLAA